MAVGRFIAALTRRPGPGDCLLAAGLAGAALVVCALLRIAAPGTPYFTVLIPAVATTGVMCGTAPALAVAAGGGMAIATLLIGRPLLAWPPANPAQLDLLVFLPVTAVLLWATRAMRRSATGAAAAEARLAEVFRQVPGAAAILAAPDGRLVLRSTQSDAVLGHGQKRLEHSDDMAAYGGIHPDGRPYTGDEYPIVRALKTGDVIHGERLIYRRSDGRVVDLEVHAGPVRGPDGKIVASVGMAFDITERVAAEQRLLASEAQHRAVAERLRAAIDAGALGLWELDLETQRLRLDGVVAGMLGLGSAPVEMARAEIGRFVEPDDQSRAGRLFAVAIAEGRTYADELRLRTAQGAARWLITRGTVLADLRLVVGVVSDVTERRLREDALAAALQARDVLMYEADHRIKNSLQLVVSLLILQRARVSDPDARHALGQAIARVNAVADAHLALQRSPDLRSIAIDGMLADLCRRLGSLNPAVAVRCEARVGLPLDAEQAIPLGLIASELLTNALRHAYPPGTAGTVTLTARAIDGMLTLGITDAGVGLPAAPSRAGLGSTVVATLAGQIGAIVTTESRTGCGTAVTVRLRLAVEAAASATSMSPVMAGEGRPSMPFVPRHEGEA